MLRYNYVLLHNKLSGLKTQFSIIYYYFVGCLGGRAQMRLIQSACITSALLPQGSWYFNLVAKGSIGPGSIVQCFL